MFEEAAYPAKVTEESSDTGVVQGRCSPAPVRQRPDLGIPDDRDEPSAEDDWPVDDLDDWPFDDPSVDVARLRETLREADADIAAGRAMSSAPLPAWVLERNGVHEPAGSWSAAEQALKPRSSLPVYQRQRFPDPMLGETFAQGPVPDLGPAEPEAEDARRLARGEREAVAGVGPEHSPEESKESSCTQGETKA